jgi:hypothetical protein
MDGDNNWSQDLSRQVLYRRWIILAFPFPSLPLAGWQPTRDTLQVYTQIIGKIRESMTPRQKNGWHANLRATATGLSTMPVLSSPVTFEVVLDLTLHKVLVNTSRGERWSKPLQGQSQATFARQLLGALSSMGIHPDISRHQYEDQTWRSYDPRAVEKFWRVFLAPKLSFRISGPACMGRAARSSFARITFTFPYPGFQGGRRSITRENMWMS